MQRLIGVIRNGLQRWIFLKDLDSTPAAETTPNPEYDKFMAMFDAPGPVFLHVGCGAATKKNAGPGFQHEQWREIRLDINPADAPDIVCSMLDMYLVADCSVDAVFSSHNIEHLYPHEVPLALAEFLRVLKPGGILVLTCPDLQSLARLIAEGRLTETLYSSPVGPIAALDMLYGHRPQLALGNVFMAHKTGFIQKTLLEAARASGFRSVAVRRRDQYLDLWMVAVKSLLPEPELEQLADLHIPS